MVKQSDIILLNFDPQSGHEQKGRRPALVISRTGFFEFTKGAAIVCPITTKERDWKFRVKLPDRLITHGFVMCEQIKSLDLRARKLKVVERVPDYFLQKVIDTIKLFF